MALNGLGEALREAGRQDEAEHLLRESVVVFEAALQPIHARRKRSDLLTQVRADPPPQPTLDTNRAPLHLGARRI